MGWTECQRHSHRCDIILSTWLICFKFRIDGFIKIGLISHIWHGIVQGGLLFDLNMVWRGWLFEIPEAGFRGRSDSRVKWEGSIALGWLDWGCMGVLAGGAPVMNRVFDYLRLALKGRTKTPGQRLRASQLSYRMLGWVFLPPSPHLNTTVAFSILAKGARLYLATFAINLFVVVYSALMLELFTM